MKGGIYGTEKIDFPDNRLYLSRTRHSGYLSPDIADSSILYGNGILFQPKLTEAP